MERVGRPSAIAAVVVALAAVVLVALVATGERVLLATEGSGGGRTIPPRSTGIVDTEPARALDRVGARAGPPESAGAGVVSVMVQTVLVLGCVVIVVLVVQALRRHRRGTVTSDDEPTPEAHWAPTAPAAMAMAVDEGLGALRSGAADEVIVACWVRLEDAAAAAGIARRVGETPAELASRVLADLHAPPSAVDELLTRYRLARYSHHPLDEDDRTVAIHALEEIGRAIAGVRA